MNNKAISFWLFLLVTVILFTTINADDHLESDHAPSSEDDEPLSASDKATAKANTQSLSIVNNLPRGCCGYGGVDELTQDEVDIITKDPGDSGWLEGIGGLFGVCLIFPILSLALCPFWCLCRCFKCLCCKRSKKEDEDLLDINRLKSYWCPFVFIMLLTVVMVVMSGMAYGVKSYHSLCVHLQLFFILILHLMSSHIMSPTLCISGKHRVQRCIAVPQPRSGRYRWNGFQFMGHCGHCIDRRRCNGR